MHKLFAVALLAFPACAAAPNKPELEPAGSSTRYPITKVGPLVTLFQKNDPIVLMSHDGEWIGTDTDLEIRLNSDGSALITDFGFAVDIQRGHYTLDSSSRLSVTNNNGRTWPPMHTGIQSGLLVVFAPTDDDLHKWAIGLGVDAAEIAFAKIARQFDQWPLRQTRNR